MKKLTAVFLLLGLLASAAAGCGSTSDPPAANEPSSPKPPVSDVTPDTPNTPDTPADPAPEAPVDPAPEAPEYEIMEPAVLPTEGMTIDGEYFSLEALALRAVGDAYVNRNEWIQYDDSRLVANFSSPAPIYRWSHGLNGVQDPENSSEKHTLYTNCAAFIHTLYKETFDFDLGSWTTAQFIERDDMIVYKYHVTGEEDSFQRQSICNKVWEMLKPGDLIVYRYGNEQNGHIMAYIGGDMLVHSTAPGGGSYDYSTPKEKAEATGSIEYMSVTKLFQESFSRYLFKLGRFAVLRPLEAFSKTIRITDETMDRMKYMSGVVSQLYSTHPYGSSVDSEGQQITYTIKIENKNTLAVQCEVQAELDGGVEYIGGADRYDGKTAYWEVTVAPQSTLELNYTVAPKASASGKITCGVVKVNGVQLKCPDIAVRNTLSDEDKAAVSAAAQTYVGKKSDPMQLVNSIYRDAIGMSPELEGEKAVFGGVFSYHGGGTSHLIINDSAEYFDLVVDAVYGGRYVVNSIALSKRTSVVRPLMLTTGDVLIASTDLKGDKCSTYMMLAGGRLMELDYSAGARVLSAADSEDLLMKILAKHAFAVLRPSYGM